MFVRDVKPGDRIVRNGDVVEVTKVEPLYDLVAIEYQGRGVKGELALGPDEEVEAAR